MRIKRIGQFFAAGFFLLLAKKRSVALLLGTLAGSVLVRLPYIVWPATVDWDESTFYLIASRIVRGELPYTTTFENKSPLTMVLQATPMLFGITDPHLLRLCAALALGLALFMLVTSCLPDAPTIWQLSLALAASVLYVAIPGGFGWMTELNIIFGFSVAWLLASRHLDGRHVPPVLFGVVIGLLPLIRTNWAVVALVMLIAVLVRVWKTGGAFRLIFGAATPTLVVVVLYAAAGQLPALIAGAVRLPAALATSSDPIGLPAYMGGLLAVAVILLAMSWLVRLRRRERGGAGRDLLLVALAAAVALGALFQSPDYAHQSLQMVPFVLLGAGRLTAALLDERTSRFKFGLQMTAVTLLVVCAVAIPTYVATWRSPSISAAAASEEVIVNAVGSIPGIGDKSVWAMDSHYLYYRLGKLPISPIAAHPCLLTSEPALAVYYGEPVTAAESIRRMFALDPDVIVISRFRWWPGSSTEADEARNLLETHYQKDTSLGDGVDVEIWIRQDTL
ncbi:MAG: hypothetical protein HGA39_08400 [Coriobacteriia bacterium]|nr:hypothetical protein [Coriobacteriia bacterium]